MDLAKVIRLLRVKLHHVDKQIAAAEEALRKRRGRKRKIRQRHSALGNHSPSRIVGLSGELRSSSI